MVGFCTPLHEILEVVLRSALQDEAMANGLKGRIAEIEDRLARLQDARLHFGSLKNAPCGMINPRLASS
jgi:hypothetical protein